MLLCQGADLGLLLYHIPSEPWCHPEQNLLLTAPSQVPAWSPLLFLLSITLEPSPVSWHSGGPEISVCCC